MKTKKFQKKLTLNKKTIANLKCSTMSDVVGGRPPTMPECETLFLTYCPFCVNSYKICDYDYVEPNFSDGTGCIPMCG